MKLSQEWQKRLKIAAYIFNGIFIIAVFYTIVQWIRSTQKSIELWPILIIILLSIIAFILNWLRYQAANKDTGYQFSEPRDRQLNLGFLRQQIAQAFNVGDLRTLCFDLDIDYEDLIGENKTGKIVSLLKQSAHQNRLPALLQALAAMRPNMNWDAPTFFSQRNMRNRQNLLQNVQSTWIDGFLKRALHTEISLELGLTYQPEAVARKLLYVSGHNKKQSFQTDQTIQEIFESYGRSLLILGAPGSGKTITLLQLAETLLRIAKSDPNQPVPIILNLSSWTQQSGTLVDWLVDEVYLQYQMANHLFRRWVAENQIIFLLDGLDEVDADYRNECVSAINEFKAQYPVEIVVCSRIEDYDRLKLRLNLATAVCIQQLTKEQIQTYLSQPGLEMQAVRATLESDPIFFELARFPLMLNVMTLAYHGKSVDDLEPLDSIEARRHHLFENYIVSMFARRTISRRSRKQRMAWLTWLARKMEEHAQSVFYIERLQPSWLKDTREQWVYSGRAGLLFAPIFTALVMLFLLAFTVPADFLINHLSGRDTSRLLVGMAVVLAGSLSIGVLTGLLFALETYHYRSKIELVEVLRWSKSKAALFLTIAVFGGLVSGFISSQVGLRLGWLPNSLLFGFISGSVFGGLRSIEYRHIGAVARGVSVGLAAAAVYGGISMIFSDLISPSIVGLLGGLGFGLLLGLLGGTAFGLEFDEVERKISPNQGIWRSAKNAFRVGMGAVFLGIISGLLVAILILTIGGKQISDLISKAISITLNDSKIISPNMIFILTSGVVFGLFSLLLVGPVGGFRFGGRTIMRHVALRITMSKKGYLPLDLISFLDEMVGVILMRRVGGGWIFIHRYLLEHFAANYKNFWE